MVRRGIYFRMLDRNKQMRFRNETQFELRDDCIIYSTSAMVGQAERTVRLPIAWQDATSFIVNWSLVNEHWSNAAIFRAHREHGAEGLQEQHRHFWRYAGPAAQTSRNNQGSQQASNSSHTPRDLQEPLVLMLASRRRRRGLSLRRQRLYDLETPLLLAFAFRLRRRRLYRRRHWIPSPTKLASMTSTQSLMGMAPGTLG